MKLIIPAKEEGSEALNAFSIGIQHLVKNKILSLQNVATLMSYANADDDLEKINNDLINAKYDFNYCLDSECSQIGSFKNNANYKSIKELLSKQIPDDMRPFTVSDTSDCFFDSIAQSLTGIGRPGYNSKILRKICYDYVVKLEQNSNQVNWIYQHFFADAKKEHFNDEPAATQAAILKYKNYKDNICYTAQDIMTRETSNLPTSIWVERNTDERIITNQISAIESATRSHQNYMANINYTANNIIISATSNLPKLICGDPRIDGGILTKELGFSLHIINLRKTDNRITSDDDVINGPNHPNSRLYTAENRVHVASFNNHFTPILPILPKTNVLIKKMRESIQTLLKMKGEKWIYSAFKCAFMKYCATKLNLPLLWSDYALHKDNSSEIYILKNVYIFEKLTFSKDNFEIIYNDLIERKGREILTKNQLRAFMKEKETIKHLKASWNGKTTGLRASDEIFDKYLKCFDDEFFDIGDIELRLLAEELQITLKIKRFGDYITIYDSKNEQKIVLINDLESRHSELLNSTSNSEKLADELTDEFMDKFMNKFIDKLSGNIPKETKYEFSPHWGAKLGLNNITEMGYCYNKIRVCYQFLDKIFDDSIFNLGYECYMDIKKFPRRFQYDQNSGYIDFKSKRDFFHKFRQRFIDEKSQIYGWRGLRNWVAYKDIEVRNNKQGDAINHYLEEFSIIADILEECPIVKDFVEKTSIKRKPKIYKKSYGKDVIDDNELINKLIDVTRDNFTYRTQRDLIEKRDGYGRYLVNAGDPSNFIMLSNLDINDKKNNKKTLRKLGLTKEESINKIINLSKIKNDRHKDITICCCTCLANICRPITVCCDGVTEKTKTNSNLYTYDGWTVRNCCNIAWLFLLSSFATAIFLSSFIIPRSLFKADEKISDSTETAYDIMNSVAGMVIPIFTLFLGIAIISAWNNCHNWYHDRNERNEYHKDMAKILYRTKLCNFMEQIELEIEWKIEKINKTIFNLFTPPMLNNKFKKFNDETLFLMQKTLEEKENYFRNLKYKTEKYTLETLKEINCLIVLEKIGLLPPTAIIGLNKIREDISYSSFFELGQLLLESLRDPNIHNKIENIITKHINEATSEEKNPVEDITQSTGENLQVKRIRRAYIKWEAGVRIKEELQDKRINGLFQHFGFFIDPLDKNKRPYEKPNDCYSFIECYDNKNIINSDKIKRQIIL